MASQLDRESHLAALSNGAERTLPIPGAMDVALMRQAAAATVQARTVGAAY